MPLTADAVQCLTSKSNLCADGRAVKSGKVARRQDSSSFLPSFSDWRESWLPSRLGACVLRRPQITYLYLNSFEPLPSFQKSTLGGARLGTLTHAARFLHGGSASMPVSFFPFAYLAGGDAPLFSRPLGLVFPPLTKWSDPRSGWHICLMVRSSLLGTDRVYGSSEHEAERRPTRPGSSERSGVSQPPACISFSTPRTMSNSWANLLAF